MYAAVDEASDLVTFEGKAQVYWLPFSTLDRHRCTLGGHIAGNETFWVSILSQHNCDVA